MLAAVAYLLGSYILATNACIKETIMKLTITNIPKFIPIAEVDRDLFVLTSSMTAITNNMSVSSSIMGMNTLYNARAENRRVNIETNTIEVTIVLHYRGSISWSLRYLISELPSVCTVTASIIKKE